MVRPIKKICRYSISKECQNILLGNTLRGCLDRLLARRLLRVSLLLRLLKAIFQLLDPTLLLFKLVAVVAISRWNCRIQLAHLTEN